MVVDSQSSTSCDLLVIGSGAAGMAAAIAAQYHGLSVIIVEKDEWFGGTTALSGGWLWIPCNSVARRGGAADNIAAARQYLQAEAGNYFSPGLVDAFLSDGPRMIEFFENNTAVRFIPAPTFPDYHPNVSGSSSGRSICAAPFDGRKLGRYFGRLRPPLPEMRFLGLAISSGTELNHFLNVTRSLRSAAFVAWRLVCHASDLVFQGRSTRLTNGNALAARLFKSCLDVGIPVWFHAPARELIHADGAVRGAIVERDETLVRVEARRGVVLATGGFSHDQRRRAKLAPFAGGPEHWLFAPRGNTGDGLQMGEAAGGTVNDHLSSAAAWAPVSRLVRKNGDIGLFAHIIDRAKPGVIAVTRRGKRFVNEAQSYHDFVLAMIEACRGDDEVEAYLLCDHHALRRYGLGLVKPFPLPIGRYLRSGYLESGKTVGDLAEKLKIDAAALENTILTFNRGARDGRDLEFGKGDTAYNRYLGDQNVGPNPCLAPLQDAPFYAIRVVPGVLGTYAGLNTDGYGRVVSREQRPIKGLYAVGGDMMSIMGGNYPGGGTNLGPYMTFGFIAGRHAAGVIGEEKRALL